MLTFFFKINFFKSSFWITIRESNGLYPDQDRRSVGSDLGPTVCKGYQQTSKVAADKERVRKFSEIMNAKSAKYK